MKPRSRVAVIGFSSKFGPTSRHHSLQEVITHTLPRGVRAAHSASAILLAVAFAGAQPSPHDPVRARAIQYQVADAFVGISESAVNARSEKTIVRMILPPMLRSSRRHAARNNYHGRPYRGSSMGEMTIAKFAMLTTRYPVAAPRLENEPAK
jgi:hypothetical protein